MSVGLNLFLIENSGACLKVHTSLSFLKSFQHIFLFQTSNPFCLWPYPTTGNMIWPILNLRNLMILSYIFQTFRLNDFFKENLRSFSQVIPKQKFNPIWALALQVTLFRRMTFKLFYLFVPKWKFKPEFMALPFLTWSDLNLQYLRMITLGCC